MLSEFGVNEFPQHEDLALIIRLARMRGTIPHEGVALPLCAFTCFYLMMRRLDPGLRRGRCLCAHFVLH
jgi:hypothetical protein